MSPDRVVVDATPAEGQPRGCVGVWTFIPLRRRDGSVRAWTLVDHDTYEWAKRYPWHIRGQGYVGRNEPGGPRRQRSVLLHREILGLQVGDGLEADHINHDKLDNRRQNLRAVTDAEQMQNVLALGGTSPFRGVSRCSGKRQRPWKAQVGLNGCNRHLGYFATEAEAADVVAAWRAEHMPFATE